MTSRRCCDDCWSIRTDRRSASPSCRRTWASYMSRSSRRSSGSGTDIPPHDFVGRVPPEGWWRGNCTEVGRLAGDLLKLAPLTPQPCCAWSPSRAEAGEELGRSAGHRVEHVLADPAIDIIGVEETEQDRRQDQGA